MSQGKLEFSEVLPFVSLSFQFEIRQLRAHLAQQDLDLVAEREAAMQIHHMWGKQSSSFQEVDGLAPGASEHHGPAKAREPGGPAGNRLEHPTLLYYRLSKTSVHKGGSRLCFLWYIMSTQSGWLNAEMSSEL